MAPETNFGITICYIRLMALVLNFSSSGVGAHARFDPNPAGARNPMVCFNLLQAKLKKNSCL
jgi:hypothetical protein